MIEINTSKGHFLFVSLPEGAYNVGLYGETMLVYKTPSCTSTLSHITLPDNRYIYIATTATLKEEDAAKIVGNNGMGCYDNLQGVYDNVYTCLSAMQSLTNHLKSHGLTTIHAIVKIL